MHLEDSDSERSFRERVRTWLDGHVPAHDARHDPERLAQWHRDLLAAGFVGGSWPAEFGGGNLAAAEQAILNEELARSDAPPLPGGMGLLWVGPAILRFGTPEQKERFVRPILAGQHTWCTGYSEPGAGSDLASLRTRAVRDGDHYRVEGHKMWTTLAQVADYCFLLCRTSDGERKQAGLTILLVDMKTPGLEIRPLRQMTGEAQFSELFLNDIRVPADCRLGAEGQGWEIVRSALVDERTGMAASIRVDKDLEAVVELARRGGKTSSPALRQKLASLAIGCHVLRWSSARMHSDLLRGRLSPGLASSSKLFTSTLLQEISEAAMEVLGAASQLYEPPEGTVSDLAKSSAGYKFLYNRCLTIAGGTSEVQRNIIAQGVLGLPR